jgi:hypothetical protein
MSYFWVADKFRFLTVGSGTATADTFADLSLNISKISNGMMVERTLWSYVVSSQIVELVDNPFRPPQSCMMGAAYMPNPDGREGDPTSITDIIAGPDSLFVDLVRWRPIQIAEPPNIIYQWYGDSGGMQSSTGKRKIVDKTHAKIRYGGAIMSDFFGDNDGNSVDLAFSGVLYVRVLINRVFS